MDPSHPTAHSQEPEGDFTNITQCSNLAGDENADQPSADELTNQTDVSLTQVTEDNKETKCGTDTTEETSSGDDRSEIAYDVGKNGDDDHLERDNKGSWSNVEDKKGPKDVLKEITKTHGLYCPNCTHNITETATLFEKGQETLLYNKERFIFVIVISFKYPFIYLPWLYNNTPKPEPVPTIQPEPLPPSKEPDNKLQTNQTIPPVSPKKPVITTEPDPPRPKVLPDPKPDSPSATLLEKIREKLPNRLPRPTPTSQRFLLFLVLLLLAVILLLTLLPRPSPTPGPIKPGNSTKTGAGEGGGVFFSWLANFLSNNYISIILLLFIAILAVLWRSMIEGPQNDPQEADAVTNPQKPDDGTVLAEEVIPETKRKINGIVHITSSIKLDILKSIVYGGLIESITSFGVVSSAAASGDSTLNVLALGLANLFSGLFIIIQNLYGLFKRPRYQSWNNDHMTELVSLDPYEELLGNRNRVILHCFVVLVSFIFFAVIPPLFYGFSFTILTDKEGLAIFFAASMLCVISLSFAKAYAFGMDKVKTVAAYAGIAISGSSLSYFASQYVRDVFAKYDFHKLAADYP